MNYCNAGVFSQEQNYRVPEQADKFETIADKELDWCEQPRATCWSALLIHRMDEHESGSRSTNV